VFKASDYRISPFELESVLIEHPAVAEAAVVPSARPGALAVPKAFVILAAGHAPDAATACLGCMTYGDPRARRASLDARRGESRPFIRQALEARHQLLRHRQRLLRRRQRGDRRPRAARLRPARRGRDRHQGRFG
jgi:acyl-CoA synthetase (AMP-forming)/AMP-acid ligase II